ncbi:MAG: c-type cytochrome biogenesis protein CcmI [Panacagrimonas sp.]
MALAFVIVMTLACIAWTTRPLWRGHIESGLRRRAANVAAYRQRLAELEVDRAAGLVDADTAAGLKTELDSRLLFDAEPVDAPVVGTARSGLLSGVLGVFLLAAAVLGYFGSGSWKVQQQVAAGPGAGNLKPESVEAMVDTLARRLEQNPQDVNGWALLGRSYFVMGRYADAAKAYATGSKLVGEQEPDLLVDEGEALGLARDRDLLGRPQELFAAALALAPRHGKALWYAGLAAEQAGNEPQARAHWVELSKQELPPELRAVLDERLASGASGAPAVPVASAPPAPAAVASAPVLQLAVSLSPQLASQVPADATLFVFAKAESGPPMPLAVYRGKASELPRQVRLDDSMAMMPAAKLSNFDRWVVTARVSRGGGVQAMSGDMQGSLTVARSELGIAALELVIDQVVP